MNFKNVYVQTYKYVGFGDMVTLYHLKSKQVYSTLEFLDFNIDIIKCGRWFHGYINLVCIDHVLFGKAWCETSLSRLLNLINNDIVNILNTYSIDDITSKIDSFIKRKLKQIKLSI